MTVVSAGSESGSIAKPWFCEVISTFPDCELLDRMVRASMPELQLVGLAADGESHDLVPETDAEHRHVGVHQLTHVADRVRQCGRVAGTVAQEDPVRLDRQQIRRRRGRRKDMHVAAVDVQPPQDVVLDAEVVGRDLQAS